MDTSETYIKMRLAAIPNMGMGKPPELIPNVGVAWLTIFVFVDSTGDFYYSNVEQTCQLERQDQLQEMVRIRKEPYSLLDSFCQWFHHSSPITNSMEQLWLAFVMKEKYNKVWDGEAWVKREIV